MWIIKYAIFSLDQVFNSNTLALISVYSRGLQT